MLNSVKMFSHNGKHFLLSRPFLDRSPYQRASEFQAQKLAVVSVRDTDQTSGKLLLLGGRIRLMDVRDGRNLKHDLGAGRQMPLNRQQGPATADIQSGRELDELLPSGIQSAYKNRYGQGEALEFPAITAFKRRHTSPIHALRLPLLDQDLYTDSKGLNWPLHRQSHRRIEIHVQGFALMCNYW